MKQCKDFCKYLSDFLDGEVGAEEYKLIEEHLEVCSPCAMTYESLKTTVDICNKGLSDNVPDSVRVRLKEFLRSHCKQDHCEMEQS
jgi:predicted anti-sigma-YlaC factor YlaD